jgi:hypothetical protein
MRTLSSILFAFAIVGCASNVARNNDYDPNEIVVAGMIISKGEPIIPVSNETNGDAKTRKILEGAVEGVGEVVARITIVGGIAMVILLDAMNQETNSQPVAYTVRSTEDQIYIILNEHLGFSVGDCVDLFISTDLVRYPPRMAYGSSC